MPELKTYLIAYSLGGEDGVPLDSAVWPTFKKALAAKGFRDTVVRSDGTKILLPETTVVGKAESPLKVAHVLLDAETEAQAEDLFCRITEVVVTEFRGGFAADRAHPLRELLAQRPKPATPSRAVKVAKDVSSLKKNPKRLLLDDDK